MWGFNNAGQLGRNSVGLEGFAQLKGIPTMVGVVVAHDHTIGIASDGRPYIWGSLEYLACGGDFHPYTPRLIPVSGLPTVSAADGNWRLIGLLTKAGEVFQVGCVVPFEAGSIIEQPARVEGLPRISALAVGGSHRLALSEIGEVWSWGGRDPCMRTTDGHKVVAQSPAKKVTGLPKIVAISAGDRHAMALDESGTVWVWGSNENWQLGIHGSTCESSPLPLAGLPPVKAIATGWFESAALTEAGKVLFWGNRTGRGFTQPALITNLDEVMSVSLGGNAAVTAGVFVIKTNGDVLKWLPDERPNYSTPTSTASGRLSSFPDPSGSPFNAYRHQR
jgi:alpha-tubulin suppressor-like RCC1 family protein